MMNALLVSFGDGMMMGRIDWPVDGLTLAVILLSAFALLLMGLLRESRPAVVEHRTPTRLRPPLSTVLPRHQTA